MKILPHLVFITLICAFMVLTHLPYGIARALNSSLAVQLVASPNRNNTDRNATTVVAQEPNLRSNDTAVTALPAQTRSLEFVQGQNSSALEHIRKKRQYDPMPYDKHTRHLPCDLDTTGRGLVVVSFPNHCIWVYNNKYNDEESYRIYKIYQTEAFFFGQYYERLKRFEIDPHTWDYKDTKLE